MARCIGPGIEPPLDRGFCQHPGVLDEQVDGIDTLVEIVFDLVEVPVVGLFNLRRDVALGDPVNILSGDVEGSDDGIEGAVDTMCNFKEIPRIILFLCPRR